MNNLVIEQLRQLADSMDWVLVIVKDEDGRDVMVTLGDAECVEAFFSED